MYLGWFADGISYDADIKILLKRHARQCVAEQGYHRRFIDVVLATSLDNRYTMQNRIDIILRSFRCSDSSRIVPGIGLRDAFMLALLARTGLRGEEVRKVSWRQCQPYTFRHRRSVEHKGMVAMLVERQ
ncbi:hypothetical protein ROZALSC1DRAFT_29904 [Rozella allomycis CSF55]|uniref:Uncharacterized protein n=1 Tax=Rozella allomycis (strain CSF55) TaxID=988480 RepID=A0A075B1Y6_ROZAC|nr:hypothetical protein O9G_004577 [Rozella allomycis CSF55]RKP18406.1 hypothetical protein ROZALSC1DRAFT_29904 [Rozella allomycis CSF55]|eukprot:EPZ34981.1 hypothetical protein O9G_004577 [Rozella allomycis CSF55]